MRTLMEMMDAHADLHEAFARHRDLIVGLEFARARHALVDFGLALHRHIADEEREILPLYRTRVGPVPGGKPEYFAGEHARILALLAGLLDEARTLSALPNAGCREAHEFLEKESTLLRLLEHHEARERAILYPELDKRLSEAERIAVLERCASIRAGNAESSPTIA